MAAPRVRVVPEGSEAFEADLSNLTSASLFVHTSESLVFRQALSVHIGQISVHGEVAMVSRAPAGVLVTFRPSEEALHELEDLMEEVGVIEIGVMPTSLEDLEHISDQELDALPDSDPEGPTNTEGEPIDVEEHEDVSKNAMQEVRQAFTRTKFPPSAQTERVTTEDLQVAQENVRATGDRDPTLIPATAEGEAPEAADNAEAALSGSVAAADPNSNPRARTVVEVFEESTDSGTPQAPKPVEVEASEPTERPESNA